MKSVQGKDTVAELLRSLKSANPVARRTAVRELGELGCGIDTVVPVLRQALFDADEMVRIRATRALGHLGEAALAALVEALQHRDKYVRREATWALTKLGSHAKAAVSLLIQALRDPDRRVRMGAANALGVIGPPARLAIPALIETLNDTNLVLCRLAAKALAHIGPAALAALHNAVRSEDTYVRREAGWAIARIERSGTAGNGHEKSAKDDRTPISVSNRTPPNGRARNGKLIDTAVLQLDGAAAHKGVTLAVPDMDRLAREVATRAREE